MKKTIVALLLAFVMLFAIAGCAKENAAEPNEQDKDTQEQADDNNGGQQDADDPEDKQDDETENNAVEKQSVNIGFMKGPTGIGAAYMMQQNDNGETRLQYNVTVESDVSNVNSALISGELDMAAVPTNVASTLYNKTEGKLQIVAINTLGVLYILENGDGIDSVYDLAGKTIYATGQGSNPQYVIEYILKEYGFTVGEDVFVEYLASDELATKMAAGDIDVAMLPVPNATSVMVQNENVRKAISITDEWESVTGGSSILTQGCIVANSETVTDEMLEDFLADYEESITYMADTANLDAAAELAVQYEIVGAVPVAKKAIPDCNLVFVSGADTMREYLSGYYEVLYSADPTSIGGSVPDDGFYR
ncbi:MAG: ABC transporter substrate-binding protein [Oscillospiraceae bacterium]